MDTCSILIAITGANTRIGPITITVARMTGSTIATPITECLSKGMLPRFYYAPAFYGWAYNPWVAPVPYAWGFAANPWYGYYGYYFTPYPVYPSASLWLTDYMISQSLAAAYQAEWTRASRRSRRAAAGQAAPPPDGAVALTPEVKQLVAAEVQRQLALENQEAQQTAQNQDIDPASSGIARMLSDNIQHVFVAGHDIDLVDARARNAPSARAT